MTDQTRYELPPEGITLLGYVVRRMHKTALLADIPTLLAENKTGEALARVELEETLAAIARLAPNTRVVGAAPRLNPGAIRTVDQMQVEFA